MTNAEVPKAAAPPRSLPPLAEEDFVCGPCRMIYAEVPLERAVGAIAELPLAIREAVSALQPGAVRERPHPEHWSALEYVCHVRDVFVTSIVRLVRTRTEERPSVDPMYNDLRASRLRYNESDLDAVLGELAAAANGFREEVVGKGGDCWWQSPDWDRTLRRLPDEERTARWLVRQALHEGTHHLEDIRAMARPSR